MVNENIHLKMNLLLNKIVGEKLMIQFIIDHWTSIIEGLAALGIVVEITPVKIYPLNGWVIDSMQV